MCFDSDPPEVFKMAMRTARKEYRCVECRLPIRPGERYESAFGVWEGAAQTFRTCEVCVWLRERVADAEIEAGCSPGEAYPPFGGLDEALFEMSAEVGMVDLNRVYDSYE